ncbi:MAG: ribosome-binding factor A [Deltaproteobacteria bacterium]|nr:ribosome-binding factor A [Deltaproteobacteria bacterium]
MPTPHRTERLADLLKQETMLFFLTEWEDDRLEGMTITQARLTKDLRILRLYYVVRDAADKEEVELGLSEVRSSLRKVLAGRVSLRFVPEIEFFYDETDDLREKTEKLFSKIHEF